MKILNTFAVIAILFQGSVAMAQYTYPIKASANGRYLVDQNNKPLLLVAESAHSMIGVLTPTTMAAYFSDRAGRGFNAADILILCDQQINNCHANGSMADGTLPFTSGTSPTNFDLATPNSAYWTAIDAMIAQAAGYGIMCMINPIDESGDFMTTLRNNGPTKVYNFGAYLGNRYKNASTIMWRVGNDFQTWQSSASDNNLIHQLLLGIKSADKNHLLSTQLNYYLSWSNEDTTLSDSVSADACYTYYETYDCILSAYASSPTIPTYLDESNYEGANNNGWLSQNANTYTVREEGFWTMTSGGAGQIWGNKPVHHFDSGWQSQLGSPGAVEIQYFAGLFSNFDWWDQVPDTAHQVVTAGYGTYNGSNANLFASTYCTTSWMSNGTNSLTYCPGSTTLTVNLAKFSGAMRARWYDPSNGVFSTISGSPFANTGTHNFSTPGSNHDGDPDWVLLLDQSSGPPAPPTNLKATPN